MHCWKTFAATAIAVTFVGVARAQDFEMHVRAFSKVRYNLARELSVRLDLPLPEEAHAFFRSAVDGEWDAVSNRFEQVKKGAGYGTALPELRNELWATIHETMGIWEVWVGWQRDSSLLASFYEPVLRSMPTNSIYFGGTDYGRFVITTVNALRKPPQVFCVTQNALADNVYAGHLRAVYGADIWLPGTEDHRRAFQRFVGEVRSGRRQGGAHRRTADGRIKIAGVMDVMAVNGILCEMIFEHNKPAHPFFVEESYVFDWMYPYLEPHGLIMKLNSEPLADLAEEIVARDRMFWRAQEARLRNDSRFKENLEAEKAFSKLRSAIAGIYVFREEYDEAESAFSQAIRLCPVSPEASFRLAKMLVKQGRTADAIRIMEAYVAADPRHSRDAAVQYLDELQKSTNSQAPPIGR